MGMDSAWAIEACRPEYAWVDFSPRLKELPFLTWMSVGEAAAKCHSIIGIPLKPAIVRDLQRVYLARGAQATTAIEGNILSVDQVEQAMDNKLELPESQEYHRQAVENILDACNGFLDLSIEGKLPEEITAGEIAEYNVLTLRGLEFEDWIVPGQYRPRRVVVGPYRAPEHQHVPGLMSRFVEFLNVDLNQISIPGNDLAAGILKAILAHLYFVWIHPFGDGNGRTARLIEHRILLSVGVPSPAAHLLSNHYNATRAKYYAELDWASKTGDVCDFVSYAVKGFVEQLDEQLAVIQEAQEDVAWESYVHEQFDDESSKAKIRRRHLVMELSYSEEPVTKKQIKALSPRLAEEYSGTTMKTITRDLNALIARGLVRRVDGKYRARTELMKAFLPHSSLQA